MQEIKIYSPDSGVSNPLLLIKEVLKGFKGGRFLAYQLFIRDLKASVRQSFLGVFWLFIPAFAQAFIWIILNNQNVISVENIPMESYPAFAITGTILWTLFTEGVTKPLARFNSSKGMMVKLNFPREAIVLAAFYDLLFSLGLKLIVLVPALIVMGYYPDLNWLYAIAAILPMYLLSLSFGLILVPIGMLYTDIARGLSLLFQLLMYLSPVVFPFQDSGVMGVIHRINPISPFIEFIRSTIGNYAFNLQLEFMLWSFIGVVLFLVSLIIVKLSLPAILERSGA